MSGHTKNSLVVLGRACLWLSLLAAVFLALVCVLFPVGRARPEDRVVPLLFFGSLHQEPRVGGTHGCSLRDGSGGWRFPGATMLGSECFYLRQPSLVGPADWFKTS